MDHGDGDTHNNAPENLRPSCHSCNVRNSSRVVADDEPYRTHSGSTHRVRAERRNCEQCGGEFLRWPNKDQSRGRFCSRPCARRAPRKARTQ